MPDAKTLLVLLSDPLTPLLDKGEITTRYYNPGDVFDDVHIVLCNDDRPESSRVQPMVGRARLHLHNLPTPARFFWKTLGWREVLMSRWLKDARRLAAEIRPELIRCHGAHINATAARAMRAVSGAKVAISLHHRPDAMPDGLAWKEVLRWRVLAGLAARELRQADMVFAVYRSQIPYLDRLHVHAVELAYNALNPGVITAKDNYALSNPVRVASVGRLIPGKNPGNLIRAVAAMDGVTLDLIGDGELRPGLEMLVRSLGAEGRIRFLPAMDNDILCRILSDYDVFAAHNDYPGVPKAVLEPLLAGLPVLVNIPVGEAVPELSDDVCMLVQNTIDGYREGLCRLIEDNELREKLGRAAFARAAATWSPARAEARYADIYRRLLQGKNAC